MPSSASLPPPKDFLSYPDVEEIVSPKYEPRKDANPVLSGLPLVIASSLYVRLMFPRPVVRRSCPLNSHGS